MMQLYDVVAENTVASAMGTPMSPSVAAIAMPAIPRILKSLNQFIANVSLNLCSFEMLSVHQPLLL